MCVYLMCIYIYVCVCRYIHIYRYVCAWVHRDRIHRHVQARVYALSRPPGVAFHALAVAGSRVLTRSAASIKAIYNDIYLSIYICIYGHPPPMTNLPLLSLIPVSRLTCSLYYSPLQSTVNTDVFVHHMHRITQYKPS